MDMNKGSRFWQAVLLLASPTIQLIH